MSADLWSSGGGSGTAVPWCINRCGNTANRSGRSCERCWRACVRKSRFASRELARTVVEQMRPNPVDDPTLSVYRCRILTFHWHVGHAGGRKGKILRKRVEKARRKALIRKMTADE